MCSWTPERFALGGPTFLGTAEIEGSRSASPELLDDASDLLTVERTKRRRPNVSVRAELQQVRRRRFIVWKLGQDDQVELADGPVDIDEAAAHALGELGRRVRAADRVREVADPLLCPVEKADVGRHSPLTSMRDYVEQPSLSRAVLPCTRARSCWPRNWSRAAGSPDPCRRRTPGCQGRRRSRWPRWLA